MPNQQSEYGSGVLARSGVPVNEQAAPPNQGPVPAPVPAPQGQESDAGLKNASGEDQEYYDRVVMAGAQILFENDKSRKRIIDRLKAEVDNPAKALADTASMLMIQLDQKANDEIPEAVIIPAAVEILEQTTTLADSLNLFSVDEALLNHAAQLMMASLGEHYGVEPQEIEEMIASMSPEQLDEIVGVQGNYARKQPPVRKGEAQNV